MLLYVNYLYLKHVFRMFQNISMCNKLKYRKKFVTYELQNPKLARAFDMLANIIPTTLKTRETEPSTRAFVKFDEQGQIV